MLNVLAICAGFCAVALVTHLLLAFLGAKRDLPAVTHVAKLIALCVGFCGIVLFTHLLLKGLLDAKWYLAAVTLAALVAVVTSRIEDLLVLDLKNLSATLREIQQVKSDVYAKVDALQRTALGVAAFTADSIVSENRLTGLEHHERMLQRRDKLDAFLKDTVGLPEQQREDLLREIPTTVDRDLRRAIVFNAVVASPSMDSSARDVMKRELEATLQNPTRITGLTAAEDLLRKHSVASEALSQSIERYRRVLMSGRLPPTGRADDPD